MKETKPVDQPDGETVKTRQGRGPRENLTVLLVSIAVAFIIGNVVGTKKLEQNKAGSGEAGHVNAAYNLGLLLKERGKEDAAEAWWRRAAEAGDTGAAYNLGMLFNDQARPMEAEAWYRRAAEAGHVNAAHNLGMLLKAQGKAEGAEIW